MARYAEENLIAPPVLREKKACGLFQDCKAALIKGLNFILDAVVNYDLAGMIQLAQ